MTADTITTVPDDPARASLQAEHAHLLRQLDERDAERDRLRCENTGLRHTGAALATELEQLRLELSRLRAEREKMRTRLFEFAWEMARGGK